jgi:UDPglucose--hexose-1-phosphate uridylyltransferase
VPEIRENIVSGELVIFAPERARRPEAFGQPRLTVKPQTCAFCEGNESLTPPETAAVRENGQPNNPGWQVRVVPNKYPALTPTAKQAFKENEFQVLPAYGYHEVIIHSPKHYLHFSELPLSQVAKVLAVYQQRLQVVSKDIKVKSGLIIVNEGRLAGASIEHSHAQLFALPFVSPRLKLELNRLNLFQEEKGCLYCWLIKKEQKLAKRVVAKNKHFIALCPYASRFPYEVWLLPLKHEADFRQAENLPDLASSLMEILQLISKFLNQPPLNLYLQTKPFASQEEYHWHWEILPKLTYLAGFELGSNTYINTVLPELAAANYKSWLSA